MNVRTAAAAGASVFAALALAAGAMATAVLGDVGGVVLFVSYAGAGTFLAVRRPRNLIGWLLIVIGTGMAMGTFRTAAAPAQLAAGTLDPLASLVAWANGTGWAFVLVAITTLTVVFPGGRIPTGRAARGARLIIGSTVLVAFPLLFGPLISVTPAASGRAIDVPNPVALAADAAPWALVPPPDALFALLGAPFVLGIAGAFIRFRRSTGLERLQYRWLVAAFAVALLAAVAWVIGTQVLEQDAWVWNIPVGITFPTIPIAIAIAVLRYRLFEIDRIVSRSIGWAIVTGCLLSAFAGGVVALQAVLSSVTQGQTLAVAASTLAVFALFQPLRRRVQSAVDRRFDRARYDAQRTVDAFAEEIRHDVDLGALRAALLRTTDGAVRPTSATLWLRVGEERA